MKPGLIHLLQQIISKEVDRLVLASPSFQLCHGELGRGLVSNCVVERDGLVSGCVTERYRDRL